MLIALSDVFENCKERVVRIRMLVQVDRSTHESIGYDEPGQIIKALHEGDLKCRRTRF